MEIMAGILMLLCFCGGCQKIEGEEKRQEIKYTVCPEGHLPKALQKTLENRKKTAGTFSYKNSMYTYLVVCYGPQKYSGYSIQVEECKKGEKTLYLRTQLIGPSAGDPVVETETYPWIVVRCEKTDAVCVIES